MKEEKKEKKEWSKPVLLELEFSKTEHCSNQDNKYPWCIPKPPIS